MQPHQIVLPQLLSRKLVHTSNHTPSFHLRNNKIKPNFCLFSLHPRKDRQDCESERRQVRKSSSTPMGFKDDDDTLTLEEEIQPLNNFSHSTASAALALIALGRKDKSIVTGPAPFPFEIIMEKPGLTQKLTQKYLHSANFDFSTNILSRGNNHYGNIGTEKCVRCRRLKGKVPTVYSSTSFCICLSLNEFDVDCV